MSNVLLCYTTYISVDIAYYERCGAKFGKGGTTDAVLFVINTAILVDFKIPNTEYDNQLII